MARAKKSTKKNFKTNDYICKEEIVRALSNVPHGLTKEDLRKVVKCTDEVFERVLRALSAKGKIEKRGTKYVLVFREKKTIADLIIEALMSTPTMSLTTMDIREYLRERLGKVSNGGFWTALRTLEAKGIIEWEKGSSKGEPGVVTLKYLKSLEAPMLSPRFLTKVPGDNEKIAEAVKYLFSNCDVLGIDVLKDDPDACIIMCNGLTVEVDCSDVISTIMKVMNAKESISTIVERRLKKQIRRRKKKSRK